MSTRTRALVLATAAAASAWASACGDDTAPQRPVDAAPPAVDAGPNKVERGRYLMNNLGACTFCHTPLNPDGTRDLTRLMAGVDCFLDIDPTNPDVGCLSTRNLTSDATGLRNVTDDQIRQAIREGKRSDGKALASVMPYYIFHNMTDGDVDAIIAYLRTLPPVEHKVQANQPPWSQINDSGMTAQLIDPAEIPMPAAGPNYESAVRGRYLSSMAGLCIDCHTPELPPTAPRPIDMTRPFAGGRVWRNLDLGLPNPPFPAMINTRNITPDATGLMGWSFDQIKRAVADGKDRAGNAVCAATHGAVISPYAALEPQDLTDIVNYVMSLPAVANDTGANCEGPPVP